MLENVIWWSLEISTFPNDDGPSKKRGCSLGTTDNAAVRQACALHQFSQMNQEKKEDKKIKYLNILRIYNKHNL